MMKRVATFDELAAEFRRRVSRIVWCTLATGLASSPAHRLTWRPGGG